MSTPFNIHILEYPGAMASAIYGVRDLLDITNHQAERNLFVCHALTPENKPVVNQQSIVFIPPCLTKELPNFSDAKTMSMLKEWHQSGAVIAAACAGVFWLANAGILDGKQATTHWLLHEELEGLHPSIELVNKADMVVDQGDVITAAGIYAFQDLTLHLVARFSGYELAKKVADFSLLDLKGRLQAYYQRFYPNFNHGDPVMVKAQKFCSDRIYTNVSIPQLAEHCNLSQRTLLRRFKRATGDSPKQYLIKLRMEKAKQLIALENMNIEEIGYRLGYSDTSNFIKIFKKVAGVTPAEFQFRNST